MSGRRSPKPSRGRQRKPARKRQRKPGRLRRLVTGDRVYAFVFMGVIGALVAMAIGPLQSYTAAADRVDGLTETRDSLRKEVDRLEERRERLHDLEEIELMARSNFGLVKPGEVPFVVVTPEAELDRIHPDGVDDTPSEQGAWYRQVGRWLGDLLP